MLGPDSTATMGAQSEPQALNEQAVRLMAATELELQAKGHSEAISRLAVSRALSTAQYRVADVSPAIREQAFLDTLRAELGQAERWVQAQQAFLDNLKEEGGTPE